MRNTCAEHAKPSPWPGAAVASGYLTADAEALVYYFSKYERAIYRKLQSKYPTVCSQDDVEALFHPEKAIDLYFDVVFRATEWLRKTTR